MPRSENASRKIHLKAKQRSNKVLGMEHARHKEWLKMKSYVNKITNFIKKNNIRLERLVYDGEVSNSALSAAHVGCPISQIVKTVLFKDETSRVFAVILRGSEKVDRQKIKRMFSIKNLDILSGDEVLQFSGYPPGGVPPFGYKAIFLMNNGFKREETVYAGGGTTRSLIRIEAGEIEHVAKPHIMDVSMTP